MITRVLSRLRRRSRSEPDTLTRLPLVGAPSNTSTAGIAPPVEPGPDELAVRAVLLQLLGVPR